VYLVRSSCPVNRELAKESAKHSRPAGGTVFPLGPLLDPLSGPLLGPLLGPLFGTLLGPLLGPLFEPVRASLGLTGPFPLLGFVFPGTLLPVMTGGTTPLLGLEGVFPLGLDGVFPFESVGLEGVSEFPEGVFGVEGVGGVVVKRGVSPTPGRRPLIEESKRACSAERLSKVSLGQNRGEMAAVLAVAYKQTTEGRVDPAQKANPHPKCVFCSSTNWRKLSQAPPTQRSFSQS